MTTQMTSWIKVSIQLRDLVLHLTFLETSDGKAGEAIDMGLQKSGQREERVTTSFLITDE